MVIEYEMLLKNSGESKEYKNNDDFISLNKGIFKMLNFLWKYFYDINIPP